MKLDEVLKESAMLNRIQKSAKAVYAGWNNSEKNIRDYFSRFNTQKVGIVVMVSIFINLGLIALLKIETEPEWLVYRCVIVIIFLPWVFSKIELKDIAKDSRLLKLLYKR